MASFYTFVLDTKSICQGQFQMKSLALIAELVPTTPRFKLYDRLDYWQCYKMLIIKHLFQYKQKADFIFVINTYKLQ